MNHPSRIYPVVQGQSQPLGGGAGGENIETSPRVPENINNNNNGAAIGQNQQRRDDLVLETNTNRVIGNTNGQFSPTTNKSMLKVSRYTSIELLKKQFLVLVDDVAEKRLVEILGGLADTNTKVAAVSDFSNLWRSLLSILDCMEVKIAAMTYEMNVVYPNSEQLISELLIAAVKEIETRYLDVIHTSSLRFLDTVCTVHDIQYKHLINLRYDIRQWRKNAETHIKLTSTSAFKNDISMSFKEPKKTQQSVWAKICGSCCVKSNSADPSNKM